MNKLKLIALISALFTALFLSGCQMTGSAVQGVGGAFNKTGGAIKRLG